jgi:hypothetical protein
MYRRYTTLSYSYKLISTSKRLGLTNHVNSEVARQSHTVAPQE